MSVLFPDVPNLPGVPQLARNPFSAPTIIAVSANVLTALFGNLLSPELWSIQDSSGNDVIVPDNFLEFEHRPRWRVSDFPVQGTATTPTAFANYNKVKLPAEWRVRISKSGTLADRQALLTALDAAANNVALYSIITPERTYKNVDIQYYDVVREGGEGAYFLTHIDIYFIEVVPVQAQYSTTTLSNAQNSSAQPISAAGTIAPQQVTGSIANQAANAYRNLAFGAL